MASGVETNTLGYLMFEPGGISKINWISIEESEQN